MLNDSSLQSAIKQLGETEESIRSFLQQKIEERQNSNLEKHKTINSIFSYEIAGNCIHLNQLKRIFF